MNDLTDPSIRFAGAELRPRQRLLLVDGKDSRIGARAFDILVALIERRDHVVDKNELLDIVWPGVVVEENNLQVHVSSLRKILGPNVIATIPGRGYRFTADDDGHAPAETATATAVVEGAAVRPSSALYGRDEDLQALVTLVASQRLVSIVGAGGIGKTALAKVVADRLRDAWPDGVRVVEFAALTDAALVVSTIAGALQIALDGDATIDALGARLCCSRSLLVFDNCEHLLQPIAEVADALNRRAPDVHLLTTSQEPLHVAAEQVYRLGTLDLPKTTDVASARAAGATALLEARARAAQRDFALDDDNVDAVVDICRRLDGIPLAIELAAARLPLLGVEGLRARLDERFRILTGGARLALRRHQTLRAALDWAHGLLTDDEQAVFRRLGTFVGSFGLTGAQHVACDARIDAWAVLDHLGALVDKSLVVVEAGEPPRYRLLETTRAFALDRLQAADESDRAFRAHAEAIAAIFDRSRADEATMRMQARIERYLPDLDNARAALDWAAGPEGDPALHVGLAGAVAWLWLEVGLRREGLTRTRAAIAAIGPSTPHRAEAVLMGSWSRIAFPCVGREELAAIARAVALYRQLGDARALSSALCQQVDLLVDASCIEDAERVLLEAERLSDPTWPPIMRKRLLYARACVFNARGHHLAAAAAMEEIRVLATTLGDRFMEMYALVSLERSAMLQERLDEAIARGHEMLELLERNPSCRNGYEHIVLSNLFMSLTQKGALDDALAIGRRALPIVEKVGRLCDFMDSCAMYAIKRGLPQDAAHLIGRADCTFATGNLKRFFVEQRLHEEVMRRLDEAFSPDRLNALFAEGAALGEADLLRRVLQPAPAQLPNGLSALSLKNP